MGVLIKSPAIGPGVVVTSSILISVRVTIWAVGRVAVALLVHALTISVGVGATCVTAPAAATGSVSVDESSLKADETRAAIERGKQSLVLFLYMKVNLYKHILELSKNACAKAIVL